MADVFLSYARADRAVITPLAEALEHAGYSVWWDRHIKGGKEYGKDIEQAITDAKAVIVAWSSASVNSEWVRDEAAFARDANKLIPIQLDGTPPPLGYRQRQAIDMTDGLSDETALAELHAALDALVGSEHERIAPGAAVSRPAHTKTLALVAIPLLLLTIFGSWWLLAGNESGADSGQTEMAEQRAIAVLPFIAQSSGKDDQYFADGLTEEILNRLDALEELRVVPRTTAFTYRDSDQPLNVIAADLRVGYIVEGSLRREADRVRVTARLVKAKGEKTLWSENYDADAGDVFKVQADIAEKVAASLDILLDAGKKASMAEAGIDNPEAFTLYAKGLDKFAVAHRNLEDFRPFAEAVELFDQAFAMAPKLSRAQILASDFFSHILIDEAGGRAHDELDVEVRNNARAELDRRLRAASAAATRESDRMAIELTRIAFSDDWSRLPALSRRFYALGNVCAGPLWPGFGFSVYGHAGEVLDYLESQANCGLNSPSYWRSIAANAVLSQRFDQLDRLVSIGKARGADATELAHVQFWAALSRNQIDVARNVISRFELGDLGDETAFALAAGDLDDGPSLEKIRKLPPWMMLRDLARSGRQEMADNLAARIDAAPAGPSVLQIVVDECLCGAPFDLSRTPNFATRLKELGVKWPPKSPINWPLKKQDQ